MKLELSMETLPGVRELLQASVIVGMMMLSAEMPAKQWTVASPGAAAIVKSTGTIW